jgi:hypothetical protein
MGVVSDPTCITGKTKVILKPGLLYTSVSGKGCASLTQVKGSLLLLLRRYNRFVYLYYEDMFGFLFYFEI